jgi:hypothetical protein
MPDLKERFSMADRIESPELWSDARRRAMTPDARSRSVSLQTDRWRRAATAFVAFAVFVAAAVFAWNLSHPEQSPRPQPRPAVDLASELPTGWSELPAPPEVRSDAATAWTGTELLVWGGYEYVGANEDPGADGFAFDAAARLWEPLPPSPLAGRSDSAFAWTGQELLIWGGWDGGFRDPPYFDDGAAYDPVAGTWRMLAPAPIDARTAFSVWTGEEMIVWGSTERAARRRDGAAYDPITNAWRTIATGPIDITDGSAVWTGDEMIVFGAALDGNNHADTPTAVAAAYDPEADTWRELPPSELSPQAMTASWLGGELIAWDYDHASAAYDPVADVWQALPDVPLRFSECRPVTVATSKTVFGEFCGGTVVFSRQERAWHRAPIGAPAPDTSDGCCPVFEPTAAGDVVLVATHWYGAALEAMDRRMFAYNPPEAVSTDPGGEVLQPEPFIPQGAQRDGDLLRLPVVFPDGTEVTLVYPIPLDLASLGIQPEVSYLWKDNPPPRFPIVFLHDPQASIAEYVEGLEPDATLASDPSVEVWEMSDEWQDRRRLPQGHWLRYHLTSWTVLVALERSAEAGEVAANLIITETSGGFPVVVTSGPIALSHESGEGEGPMLAVGSTLDPSVFLWIERCSGGTGIDEVLDSGAYGFACLANGRVTGNIYGNPSTVEAIVQGLRAEAFTPAPPG